MNSDEDFADINFSLNSEEINVSANAQHNDVKKEVDNDLILDDEFALFSSFLDIENENFSDYSFESNITDSEIYINQDLDKYQSSDNNQNNLEKNVNALENNYKTKLSNKKNIEDFLCDENTKKLKKISIFDEKNLTINTKGCVITEENGKPLMAELNVKKILSTENAVDDNINNLDEINSNTKNQENTKIESFFKTGKNQKIEITKDIFKQPKFKNCKTNRPMRMYNIPEKGHISTKLDEKDKYFYIFNKIRKHFFKIDLKLLKIQYRWSWLDLFLNKKLNENQETLNFLIKNINLRMNSEYSILRRILEGDDFSYKYMILLILQINNNIIEVYDGYYSVLIKIDKLLTNYFKQKKLQVGHKIKLFGCKFLLNKNISILDYNFKDCVLKAFYNSFSTCYPSRKIGIRKKISFRKRIADVEKEGGVVSCIKGKVKKVIESKFVVQVKDYRNTVCDLESEFENIKYLMDKTNESIDVEDVKVRKYVRFVLEDESGQCLITSWVFTDEIVKDKTILFCGLMPVVTALGLHLTANRQTYIKFCKKV